MYNFGKGSKKGFSLIELMVVISVIIILLGIVMASIMEARKKSRDERRVSDISNIALAMTLYKEKNRSYPIYPNGIELGKVGVLGALDDDIKLFNGNTYNDPLDTDTSADYSYWYYSNFLCNGVRVNVVLAKSVERSGTSNYNEVCGGGAILPFESQWIPRAYAAHGGNCTMTASQTTIVRPSSGSVNYTVYWTPDSKSEVHITYPNGSKVQVFQSVFDPQTFSITPTSELGVYTVTAEAFHSYYGIDNCSINITVLPAETECQLFNLPPSSMDLPTSGRTPLNISWRDSSNREESSIVTLKNGNTVLNSRPQINSPARDYLTPASPTGTYTYDVEITGGVNKGEKCTYNFTVNGPTPSETPLTTVFSGSYIIILK